MFSSIIGTNLRFLIGATIVQGIIFSSIIGTNLRSSAEELWFKVSCVFINCWICITNLHPSHHRRDYGSRHHIFINCWTSITSGEMMGKYVGKNDRDSTAKETSLGYSSLLYYAHNYHDILVNLHRGLFLLQL